MENISKNIKITLITLIGALVATYIFGIWGLTSGETLFKIQSTIVIIAALVMLTQYFIDKHNRDEYFKPWMTYTILSLSYIMLILFEVLVITNLQEYTKTIVKIIGTCFVVLIGILLSYHIKSVKKVVDKY